MSVGHTGIVFFFEELDADFAVVLSTENMLQEKHKKIKIDDIRILLQKFSIDSSTS